MKKLLLFSTAMIFGALSLCAQTITFSDMEPQIGSSYVQASSTYQEPGAAGQNQTWDFSQLPANSEFTTSVVDPAGQPGSAQFPTANVATVIDGLGQVGYSLAADNRIEIVGLFAPSGSMSWPDPRTQIEFPLSYQATYTDTYERYAELGGGAANQEIGSTSAVVDGSGTLITPSGTFTDVLRIRTETTADVITLLNGDVIATTPFTDVTYNFVKAGFTTALLSLTNSDFSGQNSTSALYYVSGTLGLDEVSPVSDLTLYPVPARDQLTVSFDLESSSPVQFNLFAIDGRLIGQLSNQILMQGKNTVELSIPADISGGIYMLQLQSATGSETRRIVVE